MALQWTVALVGLLMVLHERGAVAKSPIDFRFSGRGSAAAIEALAARTLELEPEQVRKRFVFELVPHDSSEAAESDLGWFELSDVESNRTRVRATAGTDLAYGLGFYLRTVYHMSFSWNRTGGHQVDGELVLRDPRPVGARPTRRQRKVPLTYLNNVVTFSYSYVWYQFREWAYLLDWMALSGINLSPAYTGQEEVFRKTFNAFGISNETFHKWTTGLPYLAWMRGQNLHGCGSYLDDRLLKSQWELQKRVLGRMRELGIVAVLPAFQGFAPGDMRLLYPEAEWSRSGIAKLDGEDPLFNEIQKVHLQHLIEDFGTDNWYETDGYFSHASEPWVLQLAEHGRDRKQHMQDTMATGNPRCVYKVDPSLLTSLPQREQHSVLARELASDDGAQEYSEAAEKGGKPFDPWSVKRDEKAFERSSKVFKGLTAVDPKAMWLYQGWMIRGWGEKQMPWLRGFTDGAPKGRMVILNMFDEIQPVYSKYNFFALFDTPFIWSVLHNFGGNTGMWGNWKLLNERPHEAFRKVPGSIVGVGAAPEGVDHNPAYYTLLTDVPWMDSPLDSVTEFADAYADQRYGFVSSNARAAWRLLGETVYGDGPNRYLSRRGWLAERSTDADVLTVNSFFKPSQSGWYDQGKLLQAWRLLLKVADEAEKRHPTKRMPRTLNYDIVDVGRDAMAKLTLDPFRAMKDKSTCAQNATRLARRLVAILTDLDKLLCTESSFMTATWLDMASALAQDVAPGDRELEELLLWQARSQTTSWGPQLASASHLDSTNADYAAKEWAGQVGGIYAARHECYARYPRDTAAFGRCAVDAMYGWTNDVGYNKYPMCRTPQGSSVDVSRKLLEQWF